MFRADAIFRKCAVVSGKFDRFTLFLRHFYVFIRLSGQWFLPPPRMYDRIISAAPHQYRHNEKSPPEILRKALLSRRPRPHPRYAPSGISHKTPSCHCIRRALKTFSTLFVYRKFAPVHAYIRRIGKTLFSPVIIIREIFRPYRETDAL